MNTLDAMRLRRSIRKFRRKPVPAQLLREILEVSRLYPSGGNLQPIRFALITGQALTDAVFDILRWAMYLPDYQIAGDERPAAYLVLLRDDTVRKKCDYDVGAASTMVMLAAVEKGLASCPIGNFDAARLMALMKLPDKLQPELVIAVGYPAQESSAVPMEDTVRYTQDDCGNFLVPKWNVEDLLVFDK